MRCFLVIALVLVASRARAEQPGESNWRSSERVTCSIAAGVKFGVPVNIVLAIAEIEGGRPGQWVRNRNGTYDVGPLQFNTRYLEHLQRHYGITAADVAAAGCYSYELAAWRLRKHLEFDRGDPWTRVANYHSRSPAENERYRAKVIRVAATWARWLARNVVEERGHAAENVLVEIGSRSWKHMAKKPPCVQSAPLQERASSEETEMLRDLIGGEFGWTRRNSVHVHTRSTPSNPAANDDRENAQLLKLLDEL